MSKRERILSFFPYFYRAGEPSKLLHEVVRCLARPLEEADTHLFRIQRAHRLKVAEHAEDIMRLAAALNLTPFYFEDILTNTELDYDQKLVLMRYRVQQISRIHLNGLGTPWAIMQSAAVFINADIVAAKRGDPLIRPIDPKSFSHKAVVEFKHLSEKHREHIYLHENPLTRKTKPIDAVWPPSVWSIDNQSMQGETSAKLVINGAGDRTVLPQIYCPQTKEGILFNGIVRDGSTLVIDEAGGAILDGWPVDDWIIYYHGGVHDTAQFDMDNSVVEEDSDSGRCDGDMEAIATRPYRHRKTALRVPGGRSNWHFNVAEGNYDGGDFDFAVFALPHQSIGVFDGDSGFDDSVFEYDPSASLGIAWDERLACAFKLLLPSKVPAQSPDKHQDDQKPRSANGVSGNSNNYVARIGSIISRFRSAGVRAFVDKAQDAWVVGASIIRSENGEDGEGIEYHATRLRNMKADMTVTLP